MAPWAVGPREPRPAPGPCGDSSLKRSENEILFVVLEPETSFLSSEVGNWKAAA